MGRSWGIFVFVGEQSHPKALKAIEQHVLHNLAVVGQAKTGTISVFNWKLKLTDRLI